MSWIFGASVSNGIPKSEEKYMKMVAWLGQGVAISWTKEDHGTCVNLWKCP
jgi:hypothetical protein